MKKLTKTNSVTLIQYEGGDVIKQGDTSSEFGYQLVDERLKSIDDLDGQEATIRLVSVANDDYRVVYETTAAVDGDKVLFTIGEPIHLGKHHVEIWAGGYVFPSDNSVTIEVRRSSREYLPEQLFDNSQLTRIEKLEELIETLEVAKPFQHNQSAPSSVWVINHNLGRYPDPVVFDSAGTMVQGAVQYNDLNTLTITFNAPFTGRAELD